MSDVKEILVQWDGGTGVSAIAQSLGYSRPRVRKCVRAAEQAGLVRGAERRREAGWEQLARTVVEQVAAVREPGTASGEVARFHAYLAGRVDEVRLSVLYQRLHDEQQLKASWGTFYRYVRRHWPEAGRSAMRVTVRLPELPPGEEAQVDFF